MLDSGNLSPVKAYLSQLAPGSRRAQEIALETIAGHIDPEGESALTFPWWEIDYEHAAAVRAWLGSTYQPATARRMMSAFRQVLRNCWRLELMSSERLARVLDTEKIRGSSSVPGRALSLIELVELGHSCLAIPTKASVRDWGIISLMHLAGLRSVEVYRLRLRNIDFHNETIEVSGKGAKSRLVPLSPGLHHILNQWLEIRGNKEGPLICELDSLKADELVPLSLGGISAAVRRRSVASGTTCSPHDLRRTFVTRLIDSGQDLETIRKLCGHASIETTRKYYRGGWERGRGAVASLDLPAPGRGGVELGEVKPSDRYCGLPHIPSIENSGRGV